MGKKWWKLLVMSVVLAVFLGTAACAGGSEGSRAAGTSAAKETEADGEAVVNGWKTVGAYTYYYKDGVKVTGWTKIDGKYYYFCPKGVYKRNTGWDKSGTNTYYYRDGVKVTGWTEISGKYYYFSAKGVYKRNTGWDKSGTNTYYYKNGVKVTGWTKIDGKYYYFCPKGVYKRNTGWDRSGSNTYYYVKGVKATGWTKIKGKYYYFSAKGVYKGNSGWDQPYYYKKGVKAVGWTKIDGKYYYFDKDGALVKNQIVGTASTGYYYVDPTGVRVTDSVTKAAVSFVMNNSKSTQTQEQRFTSCFWALCAYPYQRIYGDSPDASKVSSYASYMFRNKKGNCYRYASALAYIARVLGYDCRVVSGGVTAYANRALSPHGYCEVKVGSDWLICDCSMQRAWTGKKLFLVKRSNYPFRLSAYHTYTMSAADGKITWK